jgi:hypothetical protein
MQKFIESRENPALEKNHLSSMAFRANQRENWRASVAASRGTPAPREIAGYPVALAGRRLIRLHFLIGAGLLAIGVEPESVQQLFPELAALRPKHRERQRHCLQAAEHVTELIGGDRDQVRP